MPPIQFKPIYKEKLWGGRRMEALCGKKLPGSAPIGESWELSGLPGNESQALTPPFAGRMMDDIIRSHGSDVIGSGFDPQRPFPLLCKFIDARHRLSVQIHPPRGFNGPAGTPAGRKTECWYIIDAPAGTRINIGLQKGVSREDVAESISSGTLETLLNYIEVNRGDLFFIPPGTVHTILEDTLLYEVQEPSDATLRLYDWGRLDEDGRPRPLHVEQALPLIDTSWCGRRTIPPLRDRMQGERSVRVACRYFALEEYRFDSPVSFHLPDRNSFHVIVSLAGTVRITNKAGSLDAGRGQTTLVPRAFGPAAVDADAGAHLLCYWIPDIRSDIIEPLRRQGYADEEIGMLGGSPAMNDILPLL